MTTQRHPASLTKAGRVSMILLALALPLEAADLSADQAARQAQQRYGGQVLDVQPVETDKGRAYRIKLLQKSGRVKLMLLDGRDGSTKKFKSKRKP